MFIQLLCLCTFIIPIRVVSQCFPSSSQTWTCDGRAQSNNFTYQAILDNQTLSNFILTNYRVPVFKLDQYPTSLRLFNASHNQFDTVIITFKNRHTSQLRQLILESNQIEQFNLETIVLPESLETISLANNRLTILDARLFAHLNHLEEIDLRNNQLKRILPQLLIGRHILLGGNPLECQCTLDSYRSICERASTIKRTRVSLNPGGPVFPKKHQCWAVDTLGAISFITSGQPILSSRLRATTVWHLIMILLFTLCNRPRTFVSRPLRSFVRSVRNHHRSFSGLHLSVIWPRWIPPVSIC